MSPSAEDNESVNNLDHNMMPQQPAGIQCSPHSLTYEQLFPQTRQANRTLHILVLKPIMKSV